MTSQRAATVPSNGSGGLPQRMIGAPKDQRLRHRACSMNTSAVNARSDEPHCGLSVRSIRSRSLIRMSKVTGTVNGSVSG